MAVRKKEETKREFILGEMGMKRVAVGGNSKSGSGGDHDDGGEGMDGDGDGSGGNRMSGGKKGKAGAKVANKQAYKVVRQSFAVGGLDQEYIDWGKRCVYIILFYLILRSCLCVIQQMKKYAV